MKNLVLKNTNIYKGTCAFMLKFATRLKSNSKE